MNTSESIRILPRIGAVTVPNLIIETAGGNKVNLPITWEELDELDKSSEEHRKNEIDVQFACDKYDSPSIDQASKALRAYHHRVNEEV